MSILFRKRDASLANAISHLCIMAPFVFGCNAEAQTANYGMDLSGRVITELTRPGTRAVVLFFAASDCPISNRYIPEVMRLRQEFSDQGVQFWQVYPNPGDTAAVIRQHNAQFDDVGNVVLDTEQKLVRMAHATVTPEVAVFVRTGSGLSEVYYGRIDDRYLALGSERSHARHHDLEDAITSVLDNKPAPPPGGPPVGCAIVTRQP